MTGLHVNALRSFLASPLSEGWRNLDFFRSGKAKKVLRELDRREAAGGRILPQPENIFAALACARPDDVRVVILGQDPYPTPGHAHGLAFSYVGEGPLPASLRNIFKELQSDLGGDLRKSGDLSGWARQGVLLLNTALTVESGKAGAHMKFGWDELTRQIVCAIAKRAAPAVFILWGDRARSYRALIDSARHLIIESAHPSPLSARNGFFGSKPFSRANEFLTSKGYAPIRW